MTREGRVAGKVAVVTGAATGIGRALALALAAEGASVVVADVDATEGERTAAEAAATGAAVFVRADVADPASLSALAAASADAFGPVEILCNNAGVVRWQPLRELTLETWGRLVDVNLRSVLLCTQAFLPQLELHGGSIVNVASTSALVGAPDLAAYSATKGGVVAATRALAVELAPAGIRVNVLCPGTIDTAIMDQAIARFPGSSRETIGRANPIGRNGIPADVAAAGVWLASDDAAFVTGAAIVVDGGLTAA